jgi:nucleotide-binding universal stress UspA family protein
VISPALFAMLVLMALITTFMTTPLLEWVYPLPLIRKEIMEEEDEAKQFTILIPVSLPSSGPELLRVATALAPPDLSNIYALHISRPEAGSVRTDAFPREESSLKPLLDAAEEKGVSVRPMAFVSRSPGNDIAEVARVKGADLVLMGWHKPILNQSILGGTVYDVMRQVEADVGVYLARRYGEWKRVLVPYTGSVHDRGALELARRLGSRQNLEITILHVVKPEREKDEPRLGLSEHRDSLDAHGVRLKIVESNDFQETAVAEARQGYDLVIIGASAEWGLTPTLFARHHEELARSCPASMLIVRKFVPENTDTANPEKNAPAAAVPASFTK